MMSEFDYNEYVDKEFGGDDEDHDMCPNHDDDPLFPIVNKFIKAGVPMSRLPSPEHIVSHLIECVDQKKFNAWVESYINMEKDK